MTECDEVAGSMSLPPRHWSLADIRNYVRHQMEGESETVIDNVTWSLWRRVKLEEAKPILI